MKFGNNKFVYSFLSILYSMLQIPGLFILNTKKKGRGVFTSIAIQKGDMIEICPLIIIPPKEVEAIHQTVLHDYYFLWEEPVDSACIALGFGSLYNHNPINNAEVFMDLETNEIEFRACKSISAGTEICIDYNAGSKHTVWFEVN